MPHTKGEYRVGISFNPSGHEMVDWIKSKAAEMIDGIETIEDHGNEQTGHSQTNEERKRTEEIRRLKALAQTDIETAAMHAVKAATKRLPE